MKTIAVLIFIVLSSGYCKAQGGWSKITDTTNPICTFHPLGVYDGASWIDIDNDGDIDLFAAPNNLFRNNGNGSFTRINTAIGADTTAQKIAGSTWADFDNDGDIDCFLSHNPSRYYRNDGTGVFTKDTTVFLTINSFPTWAGAWGEVNNDGKLDLILTHPKGFLGTPYPCFYFKQNAALQLPEIYGYNFTDSLAPYTVPYWSDYDLDGDMDLFIASGPGGTAGPDFHYKNMFVETGMDTLVKITSTQFAMDMHDGQCYNFIDYDNDGDFDLCLTSWLGSGTTLYNNNSGIYTPISTSFSATKSSLSNAWGDFDNDGDLDVIIANDQYYLPGYYRNDGGTFTSISNAITSLKGATSITTGDYDNDGDLDVFMMAADTTHAKALFRNDSLTLGNHWVNVKCVGTITNKSAIGTKVRLKATINGVPTWQIREILAQNTFQGQHDLRVHFGLGNATVIDSVIIEFLGGHTNTYTNLQPDKFYTAIEDGSLTTGINSSTNKKAADFKIFPNPANKMFMVLIETNTIGTANITLTDVKGTVVKTQDEFIERQKQFNISTDNLRAGNYIVTILFNESIYIQRLVIVK